MDKIVIASDHGGFELKNSIKEYLKSNNYIVEDLGTYDNNSCDYPLYAKKLCEKIISHEFERGILFCGTGLGMQICANKYKGIRAVCCSDVYSAKKSREHNNANVLTLGGRVVGFGLAQEIVNAWLNTSFLGERHQKRIDMIE